MEQVLKLIGIKPNIPDIHNVVIFHIIKKLCNTQVTKFPWLPYKMS